MINQRFETNQKKLKLRSYDVAPSKHIVTFSFQL